MIDTKDVVLAILGASTALAGFVLVFLGIVLTTFQAYTGAVPAEVKRPYRSTAVVLFTTFCVSLGTIAVCMAWALAGGDAFYKVSIAMFLLQLLALLGSAAWTLRLVLEWP